MNHHRASLWYRLTLQFTIYVVDKTDATASRRGHSRGSLNIGGARFLVMPRARPVEFSRFILTSRRQRETPRGQPVASCETVNQPVFGSCEHETPPGKPVVSANALVHHLCFTYFFLAHCHQLRRPWCILQLRDAKQSGLQNRSLERG